MTNPAKIYNTFKADVIKKDGDIDKDVDITVIKYYDRRTGAEKIERIFYCRGVSLREEINIIYVIDKNGKEHKVKIG